MVFACIEEGLCRKHEASLLKMKATVAERIARCVAAVFYARGRRENIFLWHTSSAPCLEAINNVK